MHNNNMRFWQYVAKKYHRWFALPRVLELGSFNVNGTVRDVFHSVEQYVGVDERPGPCVDVVCKASDFNSYYTACWSMTTRGGRRWMLQSKA
jgi:hypothetical protein